MKKYTKEIMLVLITAIVVSVVSVSAAVYFNSENIVFEPEDTNWNVSSTSSALNDLYNMSNTKITNFKTTIAQAITEMGITTEEDADAETMANNIRNLVPISTNGEPTLIVLKSNLGSVTSTDSYGPVAIQSAITSWTADSAFNSVSLKFDKIPKESTVIISFVGQYEHGRITNLSESIGTNCDLTMLHVSTGANNSVNGYFKLKNITSNDITIKVKVIGYAAIVGINIIVL